MDRPGGSSLRASMAGLTQEELVRWINDPSSCCAVELSQAFDPLHARFPKPTAKDKAHGPSCNATCTACNPEAHITRRATTVLSKTYYTDSRAYLRARGRRYNQNLGAGAHVYGRSYYDASGGLLYNNGDIRRAGGLFGNLTCPRGCSRLPDGKSWGPCGQAGPETGGAPGIAKGRHVYKPNNRPFQVQGAVESSTRLERLKLNTINKAAKSAQIFGAAARNGSRYTGRAEAPRTVKSDWSLSVCRRLSQEKTRCCRMVSEKLSTAPASRIPNASSGQRAWCSNSGKTSFNRNQALLDALERDPDIFIDVPAEEDPSGKPPAPPPTLEEITASYFASDQFFVIDALPYSHVGTNCVPSPAGECGPIGGWPLPEGPPFNALWLGGGYSALGQAPENKYLYTHTDTTAKTIRISTCTSAVEPGANRDALLLVLRWDSDAQTAAAEAAASWTSSEIPSIPFLALVNYAPLVGQPCFPLGLFPPDAGPIQIVGFSCDPNPLVCDPTPSFPAYVEFGASPGTSYLIVLTTVGYEGPELHGTYTLTAEELTPATGFRDPLVDRQVTLAAGGDEIIVTGDSRDSEAEPSAFPNPEEALTTNTSQYVLSLEGITAGTHLTMDMCSDQTTYDTFIWVWSKADDDEVYFPTAACDDRNCGGSPPACELGVGELSTYLVYPPGGGMLTGTEDLYVVVTGYANEAGPFELKIKTVVGPGEPDGP